MSKISWKLYAAVFAPLAVLLVLGQLSLQLSTPSLFAAAIILALLGKTAYMKLKYHYRVLEKEK